MYSLVNQYITKPPLRYPSHIKRFHGSYLDVWSFLPEFGPSSSNRFEVERVSFFPRVNIDILTLPSQWYFLVQVYLRQLSVKRFLKNVKTCKTLVPWLTENKIRQKSPVNISFDRTSYLYHRGKYRFLVQTNDRSHHFIRKEDPDSCSHDISGNIILRKRFESHEKDIVLSDGHVCGCPRTQWDTFDSEPLDQGFTTMKPITITTFIICQEIKTGSTEYRRWS